MEKNQLLRHRRSVRVYLLRRHAYPDRRKAPRKSLRDALGQLAWLEPAGYLPCRGHD